MKRKCLKWIMAVFIGLTCFCGAYSQTAMAAVHSKTPDILGTTGKNNLNQAYKKYFDAKGGGKGGSLFHYMKDGSAYIASTTDDNLGNGYYSVKTEGMSYGMMITLQMNNEYKFQKLWDFVRKYMRHSDSNDSLYGYHSWHMKTNGSDVQTIDQNVASDGEVWFAAALMMASDRWGDKKYPYDYKARAQDLLDALAGDGEYANTGKESRVFIKNSKDQRYAMVRFGPYVNWTDPSYHVPAFFELFAKSARSSQQYFWKDAANKSRTYLSETTFKSVLNNGSTVTNAATGLFPDEAGFDGVSDAAHSSTETDRNFSYDAWRTVSHIAMDYTLWSSADNAYRASEQKAVNKFLTFMKRENYGRTAHEYTLNGTAVKRGSPVGLIAANAGGATAASDASLRTGFANAFNSTYIPEDYYGSCLYMLNSLVANGKFTMYLP
ncbi:glycosyl hydrolase family 8 [Bacillus haynesii]|uniref:glycosyl hydrolase family 8 n=1 Tax=Bacillus haynesii TaxID=1925021 RepID=UPI002283129E|nr:glycosyl hydrolase family 8 [Bacillus haynesii]MCY7770907.1 glycosyl hydrolase family 8 [Bacillus haynesii]MCY8011955.1 glycosyl hydrolase family 8 [Bacillus haynesii]MEC0762314.1 glycosyl hydrolase family 8 [Bacillus haynesii]MEC0783140.1 glycosyl hydrolase family 8 [Bacillus haynesii]